MIEPLFGTAAPPWTVVPSSGFGWPLPTPRSLTAAAPPLMAAPIGAQSPLPGILPDANGYSVPVLLTAVAVRRGQPLGPTSDQEIEDFVYDALELLPGTNEVEVRCEGGRVALTGSVQHKRLKRDVGELAWGIPIVNDVQNTVTIATKRRTRSPQRDIEPQQQGRKQG